MPVNSFDDYPMSFRPAKEELTKSYYLSIADKLEQEILSSTRQSIPGCRILAHPESSALFEYGHPLGTNRQLTAGVKWLSSLAQFDFVFPKTIWILSIR